MSLSTALIPQQQPHGLHYLPKTARIFARILEQRHGNWSCMSSRSICRNSKRTLPGQGGQGSVPCAGQAGGSCPVPTKPRISSFVAKQQQQLQLQLAQQRREREREDYRIYPQSVDLNAFFGEEQKCEKVSDVCLLNDHFILVKMPEQEKQEQRKEQQQVVAKRDNFGSKLPRCFKCNRGSRVSPILEELEEPQTAPVASSPWTSSDDDDADVEVFVSSTRIISPHNRQQLQPVLTVPVKPQPVIVEQPQPDNSMQLQLDTLQAAPVADPPAQAAAAAGSSYGAWHWFLWPFRRRFLTAGKPKAQLAAVHKTYFVRWNKPPDTLWHGYGVERGADRQPQVGLRRCRSAIFWGIPRANLMYIFDSFK